MKAIIIENNQVLFINCADQEGDFYIFPGGGQEFLEEAKHTVRRECIEEIGFDVDVHEVLFMREYIGANHEFSNFDHDVHQVETYFRCSLRTQVSKPAQPDTDQIGVEWLIIDDLEQYRIYPKALIQPLQASVAGLSYPLYLGDVN
ncbi:NUDIX hydrolase [Alkalihalobacillus pseudalcaliphilus]|nr:NUDIX domain-containing protein [Alkalihalobacillus pseudalcaliphilus]KMK76640.1 NUDIX hydrolase [Alkalihalobacillus pseudalcaliphilus]